MAKKKPESKTTKKTVKAPRPLTVKKNKTAVVREKELQKLIGLVIEGLQEKKAQGIVCLDLKNLGNAVTDYFVICHADSRTQVEAIARSVEDMVHKNIKEYPWHTEGFENAEWILLDYVTLVVHIFQKDKRAFYGLERLWADAEMKKVAS